ncbi:MAG TPA: hypothetical protein VFR47_22810 [Anaerolineales bacterium]|nr:hypothetical protein [Anaerolineales bacterium]
MLDNISRSFVVRIWIEPREVPNATLEWRGVIQDVLSGEKKYFRKFAELIDFMLLQISKDVQGPTGPEQ